VSSGILVESVGCLVYIVLVECDFEVQCVGGLTVSCDATQNNIL